MVCLVKMGQAASLVFLEKGEKNVPLFSFRKQSSRGQQGPVHCWAVSRSRGDFPGGAVVKNPPANAGDMSSSPGPGRSHMLQSN